MLYLSITFNMSFHISLTLRTQIFTMLIYILITIVSCRVLTLIMLYKKEVDLNSEKVTTRILNC